MKEYIKMDTLARKKWYNKKDNFVHENEPCIKEDCYGVDKVFFGLVESCFERKDYLEYYTELREYMSLIEQYLNGWFHIDFNEINWDLQTM